MTQMRTLLAFTLCDQYLQAVRATLPLVSCPVPQTSSHPVSLSYFLTYSINGVRHGACNSSPPPSSALLSLKITLNKHAHASDETFNFFREQFLFAGQYVTIDIEYSTEHANAAMQKLRSNGSLAVFSLLKHENKLSIMHCNVQRNEMAGDTSIIKSKEELYFQVLNFLSALPIAFLFSSFLKFA